MIEITEILPNTQCYTIHKTGWADGKIFKIVTDEVNLHNIRLWLKQYTNHSYLFWKCTSTKNSKTTQTYYADFMSNKDAFKFLISWKGTNRDIL